MGSGRFRELDRWTTRGPNPLHQTRTHDAGDRIQSIKNLPLEPEWSQLRYDRAGNLNRYPDPNQPDISQRIRYDAWNRPVHFESNFTSLTYDGLGRLVLKESDEDTRRYTYSPDWQLLEEEVTPKDGDPYRYDYIWGVRGPDDLICREKFQGEDLLRRDYALSDANGNIVGIVPTVGDEEMQVVTYDPYGQPTGQGDFAHLFGGYYYDHQTGLYLVRNRVYHPTLGRWLQKDPAGMVDGTNLYEYCAGNPVNFVDPSGGVSFWQDPLDSLYGSGGRWDVGASNSWLAQGYRSSGEGLAEMLGPEYLAQAGGWELIGLTTAAVTAGVVAGAASFTAGGGLASLAFSGAVGGGAEYLTWTLGARALGGRLAAGPTLSGIATHVGGGAVGGFALGGIGRAAGWGFRQSGRGLIGLVKPGGTVDDALAPIYNNIVVSPKMEKAIRRYNTIAKLLGQKPSASSEEILNALSKDVTFSRVGHIRAGIFDFGNHGEVVYGTTQVYAVGKRFWLQGNPVSSYGQRVGRHELLHLGAAIRGQRDTLLHEIAVQAAATPENLILGAGLFAGLGGIGVWWARQ